jgi:hypothetical protein
MTSELHPCSSVHHRVAYRLAVALALLLTNVPVFAASDDEHSKVMGSVHIGPGEHAGDATTVNGSVELGANAVAKHVESVNGGITLHEHATAESTQTVNGATHLQEGARVTRNVELVNGGISLEKGADVAGHVSNVNGVIELEGAHVGGGIETTTGDIEIGPDSRVEGGILVNKSNEGLISFSSPKIPRIVIGPGAVVKGTLRFEREVKLYVSDRASIGTVQGATVNKFSGTSP